MKKIVLPAIILMMFCLNSFSQTTKKTFLLGGYTNLSLQTEGNTHFEFNPNLGYFIADRFCIGLSAPIVYIPEQIYWGFTPFARYYFSTKENNSLFLAGGIGIASLLESPHSLNSSKVFLGIGHVWFLNKSIGFETQLTGGTNFDDLQVALSCGFHVYFNKNND